MADVQFFHQERVDGGQRSGVLVDGNTVLHAFVPGSAERDPALEWYADVALMTEAPPTESTARGWLADHGQPIRTALGEAAAHLEGGLDSDAMPWEINFNGPDGPISVMVSAVRRLTARKISEKLRQLAATEWNALFPTDAPVA